MTYVADNSIDFAAAARELLGTKLISAQRIEETELVPAEVRARMRREGTGFMRSLTAGRTVDQEGLSNNYAVEPETYLAVYPSPEQQRTYVFQAAGAFLLVALTLLTAVAVS